MNERSPSSEGEELIEEFLKEKLIEFKREKEILNLNDDNKEYRIADFYLPRYKVYLEFFGKWNVEEYRIRYQKKKEVYDKNEIPCIYVYPDNLGALDFIFKRRLKDILNKHHKLKFQRFKYNIDILMEKHLLELIIVGLLIYFIRFWVFKMIEFHKP